MFLRYDQGADGAQTREAIDRMLATSFPDTQTSDREEVKEQQAGQINQLLYLIYALLALSVIVVAVRHRQHARAVDLRAHA